MSEKTRKIITPLLLVISAALIAAGYLRGEHYDVFNKAIKVCMQCIGIG